METVTQQESLAAAIVDAAYCVHNELGPGLLESAYEACMIYELESRGIRVESQVARGIPYRGHVVSTGYRVDLLVDGYFIVEIKAVEHILPIHLAQILTYLKLSNQTLGLLINFNVARIKDGIKRVVNNHPSPQRPKD